MPRSFRSWMLLVAVGAAVSCASAATAGTVVHLNVPSSDITSIGGAFTARGRLSRAGSVDQMLFKQPDPFGYPAADTVGFIGGSFIGGVTYDFTVRHSAAAPGVGGKIDFTLANGGTSGSVVFRPGGANSTISHTFGAPGTPTGLNYNILHIYGYAMTPGSSVWLSNLAFTPGSGLTTSGLLATSGSAVQATGATAFDQWIAAETGTNLDLYDWTISGRVTLAAGGTNPSSGEGIKFEITGKQGFYPSPVAVPEPGTLAMLATAAGFGLLLRRRKGRAAGLVAAVPVVLLAASANAGTLTIDYTTLPDAPKARSTAAYGVSKGQIVGSITDETGVARGFIFDGTSYTMIDVPEAKGGTVARGISRTTVVGQFDADGGETPVSSGFVYDLESGSFTPLAIREATGGVVAAGVDGSTVVGSFADEKGTHGFITDIFTGEIQTLDHPDAVGTTSAWAVSGSLVVGSFESKHGSHGFIFDGTSYTTLDYPDTLGTTVASGVSDKFVVGSYSDDKGGTFGFLFADGEYFSLAHPLAAYGTYATGISGDTIVGYYTDDKGFDHAFQASFTLEVAPVPEPGTLAMLASAGLAGLVVRRNAAASA